MENTDRAVGFWSYTHRDDEINGGRIRELAKHISNEFELITGEKLIIFVDKESLEWGEVWKDRINSALAGTTFCIPIITPAFFKSSACRTEVLTFAGHAKSLGLDDLLLPILYVPVPGLGEEENSDEVMALIGDRQYSDWTSLRLKESSSTLYREAVLDLATRISNILERSVQVASEYERSLEISASNESPALLETMAEAESAFPRWTQVTLKFAQILQLIGDESQKTAAEIRDSDARGDGFTGRLQATRKLVERISEPVDRLYRLGNEYSAELVKIDPAILTFIRELPKEDTNSQNKRDIETFFSVIRQSVESSRTAMESVRSFRDSVGPLAGMSQAMRPLIQKIQSATQRVIDGQSIIEEWGRLIDESGYKAKQTSSEISPAIE